MFFAFFRFEIWHWIKGLMVWILLAVLTLILLSVLLAQEAILEDVFFGNAKRNSPFVILRLYGISAVFGCLMVTAFVNAAATRDFAYETYQLVYTKPITKHGYLLGRFSAATLISLIPMLGTSVAVFLAPAISSGSQWGPTYWSAHLTSLAIIAIPNTFVIAAVVFAIAVWTRSTLASFLGILALLIALSISGALIGNLANETWAAMADPFGDTAMAVVTKYWTTVDKNTALVPLSGVLLWNRLFWVAVGCCFLAAGYFRFSFTMRAGLFAHLMNLVKSSIEESLAVPFHTSTVPAVSRTYGTRGRLRQLCWLTMTELWSAAKSPVFICLIVGALFTCGAGLSVRTTQMFGLSTLPVSISMIQIIRESFVQFQIVVITFYAGVFVWRDRDAMLDEVIDSLPTPTWMSFVSKFLALVAIVTGVVMIGIFCGLFYQLISWFLRFQLGLYIQELILIDMVQFACLIVLAVLCHVLSPNKYVGYFLFIGVMVANALFWPLMQIESTMVRYGNLPSYVYSDFFARQPYSPSLVWFSVFWLLLAALLGVLAIVLWPRGRERSWRFRLRNASLRFNASLRAVTFLLVLFWAACGVWIFWNTQIQNTYRTRAQTQMDQAEYEMKYKRLADKPQPRVTDVRYDIDLFPAQRRLVMRGKQTIVNKSDKPIDTIYLLTTEPFETEVQIEGGTLAETDEDCGMLAYTIEPPMSPSTAREMTFAVSYSAKGFENSLQVKQVVQNGTFFNNMIAPQIGYQTSIELKEEEDREEHGLEGIAFTPLDPDDLVARRNSYLSNNSDWVNVETVISTSDDQIAVAPGSLIKSWSENGRNFFHYKLDHPSVNFYSFISARFEVTVRQWQGIDIEVYHHPTHGWNVELMLDSIQKSLEYYTREFGPYRHKQARIVEFPRVSLFAQAFPGTMPYSEGVGFIADLQDEDDIDMVFYVVAHEMAHQWWAHQVVGANMRGATMLSETLAQYSALLVMEKEYGRDMMRKFLQYEMDNYLRSRGRQERKERPLREVEMDQGYVHYNKGSVVMYHLKEMIGEERVNAALRSLIEKFAYAPAPYPTSIDLIDALREQTPEEHRRLLEDLFDHITLFDNRVVQAEYRALENDRYEVTVDVEFKKLRASETGEETQLELDDWIEIGAFARPAFGRSFGETLHRERVHVTQPRATYQFTVDQLPHLAGVDPISLLIDRNKGDNMRKPKAASEPQE